jgi:hypothetical protein
LAPFLYFVGLMTICQTMSLGAIALLCASCASVVDGTTQPIYVATTPISGATCTCSNDRGKWIVVTPGTVVIAKSESVLQIRCSKLGYVDGKAYAAGHMTSAGMAGAMLLGLLDAAIDASTGAALTYPGSYSIELKSDPSQETTRATPSSPTTASDTRAPTHSN